MDQVNLQISDNVKQAMEFAFDEAQQRLMSMNQSFDPFTVTVVDSGIEVNDVSALDSPSAVRESVKMLLAQDMPEGYALCYDGFVDTDDGQLDSIVVEVCDRGATDAFILVLLYSIIDGEYTFETDYCYAGPAVPLYPAGTKPIVSGLAALEAEEAAAKAAEEGTECEEAPEQRTEEEPEFEATPESEGERAGEQPEA